MNRWPRGRWALLGTQIGQDRLLHQLVARAEPALLRVAGLHRASLGRRVRLVAVTGSFGKTTTSRAIRAALGLPERRLAGNIAGFICLHLVRVRPWQRWAVYEVSGHAPGVMAPIAGVLRPDVAVVTAIGSEHLTSLGTLEATRAEKLQLVRALRSGGLAVLNGDDPHVRWMADQTTAQVVTCGFGADCEVRASDYGLDWPHGSRFLLHLDGQTHQVRSRLVGRHQVYSILAAVTVARHEGVPLARALAGLEQLPPTAGRLEIVPLPNGAYLLRDDFKGALETFQTALEVLGQVPAQRRFALLGDVDEPPGSIGPIYRQLGEQAASVANEVVLVGEQVRRYRTGLAHGGLPPESVTLHPGGNVLAALEQLRTQLGPGDVLLLKGRGRQRLERVALGLAGRPVRCALTDCRAVLPRCRSCAMLERGWQTQPPPA